MRVPQTTYRYQYLAANDTHREQCQTQYQTNAPRHGFLGGSSEELAAACAASADLAAKRRGSPGRTPSSRCCVRGGAHAPASRTRRAPSKTRCKKFAPGSRAASARSCGVNGRPPWPRDTFSECKFRDENSMRTRVCFLFRRVLTLQFSNAKFSLTTSTDREGHTTCHTDTPTPTPQRTYAVMQGRHAASNLTHMLRMRRSTQLRVECTRWSSIHESSSRLGAPEP